MNQRVLQPSKYWVCEGLCWATDGAANNHLLPTPRIASVLTMQLIEPLKPERLTSLSKANHLLFPQPV